MDTAFWSKVRTGEGCWEWTGAVGNHGYGILNRKAIRHTNILAHRYSWYLTHGEFPSGYVLHTCDNRRCVRPDHLWLGSQAENLADMRAKGRAWAPSKSLTASQVAEAEALRSQGMLHREIAAHFGVSRTTVTRALNKTGRYA